jgi:hypothetical protein
MEDHRTEGYEDNMSAIGPDTQKILAEYKVVFDKLWKVISEAIDTTDEIALYMATAVIHKGVVAAWKESGEYNGKPFQKPEEFDDKIKVADSFVEMLLMSFLAGVKEGSASKK